MKNIILLFILGLSLTTYSQDIEQMDKKELRIALKNSNASKDSLISFNRDKDQEIASLNQNIITFKDSIKAQKVKITSLLSLKKQSDENSKILSKTVAVLKDSIGKLNLEILGIEKELKISDIRRRYDMYELSGEDYVDIINMDWDEDKFYAQKKHNENKNLIEYDAKKDIASLKKMSLNNLVDGTYVLYNTNAFEPTNINKKLTIKLIGNDEIYFNKNENYKFTKSIKGDKIILSFGQYGEEDGDWQGGGEIIISKSQVKFKSLDGPEANEISNYQKVK
jgi:hypothetical protein